MTNALTGGIDASAEDMRTVQSLRVTSMIGLGDEITIKLGESDTRTMTLQAAMMAAKERAAKVGKRQAELLAARIELGELLVQIRDAIGERGDFTKMLAMFGVNRNVAHKAMKLARIKSKDPISFAAVLEKHGTLRSVEQAVGVRAPEEPRLAVTHEVVIAHMGVDAGELVTAMTVRPANLTYIHPVFPEGATEGARVSALNAAHATGEVLAAGGGVAAASTDVGASRCKDVAGQLTLSSLYEAASRAIESMRRLIERAQGGDPRAAQELEGMLQRLG